MLFIPRTLKSTLRKNTGRSRSTFVPAIADALRRLPLVDPHHEPVLVPPQGCPQFHCLTRSRGLRCPKCRFVLKTEGSFTTHLSKFHPSGEKPGKKSKTYIPPNPIVRVEVDCQRFFPGGLGSACFEITVTESPEEIAAQQRRDTVRRALSRDDRVRFQIEE